MGEFDGWAKYSRDEYLAGRTPEDVLEAEKTLPLEGNRTDCGPMDVAGSHGRFGALFKLSNAGIRP